MDSTDRGFGGAHPRSNRTVLRAYGTALHKERNLVERMWGYLKHVRRVATRDDNTARSFLSFVQLAASYLWRK
ncbi:MAG: transposase [Nitrospirota bacterium]